MAEPMAALAVARTIAKAAINTASERDNASLVFFLIIWKFDSFRLSVSLRLYRLIYFAFACSRAPSKALPFALAISITLFRFRYVLKKFRMVPNPVFGHGGFSPVKRPASNKFFH